MSCPRRRQCGGGSSWSYSWSSNCGGGTTLKTYGNVPAELLQQYQEQGSGQSSGCGSGNTEPSSGLGDSSGDYYEYGLHLHNWYRKRHGSPKMALVDRLNKAADAYAYKLACQRQLVHTSGLDYNENLYMSSDTNASKKEHVRMACKMWYDEIKLYNFNNPGFSMQTGHFTAMVWKNTNQLGIGVGVANGWVVVVACYKPHANFQGQFGANVLPFREVEDSEDEAEAEKKKEEENKDEEKPIPEAASQIFLSKADKNGTIGWEELKELLNENVKVGFNFDGWDKPICSLLISLMTIRSGEKPRVGVEEFGAILKCVEGFLDAFTEFDKDDSGTLDPFELKGALEEAGFKVGYKTYQTLQKLFADEDGDMKFREYVLCFILLSKLQIVQEKKSSSGGMFEDFSMKDWMQSEIDAVGTQ
jgi:uncharacterized protein YkwD